jgi:hypothetical protein
LGVCNPKLYQVEILKNELNVGFMDLTWLCFVALILLMIPVIYYGTRSRIQYVRRIREASARGAFADMKEPKSKSRIRHLAFVALVGAIGMVVSLSC